MVKGEKLSRNLKLLNVGDSHSSKNPVSNCWRFFHCFFQDISASTPQMFQHPRGLQPNLVTYNATVTRPWGLSERGPLHIEMLIAVVVKTLFSVVFLDSCWRCCFHMFSCCFHIQLWVLDQCDDVACFCSLLGSDADARSKYWRIHGSEVGTHQHLFMNSDPHIYIIPCDIHMCRILSVQSTNYMLINLRNKTRCRTIYPCYLNLWIWGKNAETEKVTLKPW